MASNLYSFVSREEGVRAKCLKVWMNMINESFIVKINSKFPKLSA